MLQSAEVIEVILKDNVPGYYSIRFKFLNRPGNNDENTNIALPLNAHIKSIPVPGEMPMGPRGQPMPPEMMQQATPTAPPGNVNPAAAQLESNAGVPPEADAERIKQELIDIILANKEQQSLEEPK